MTRKAAGQKGGKGFILLVPNLVRGEGKASSKITDLALNRGANAHRLLEPKVQRSRGSLPPEESRPHPP